MGKSFQGVHASIVGKFEHGDKIPQWVRANGGEFHREINPRVTHLIASMEAFKENVEAVKMAKELPAVKIVSYDWLEDSLLSKTRRPKAEGPYLLENLVKNNGRKRKSTEEPKQKAAKRRVVDPFVHKKTTKGGKPAAPSKNRIYMDPNTGESWNATLVRTCSNPQRREKYQLAIFQTTVEPYTYSVYIKRTLPGKSDVERLVGPKSDLSLAKSAFIRFFAVQTGKEWENRMDGKIPPSKTGADGNILPAYEGWFSFEAKTNIFTEFIMQAHQSPDSMESTPVTGCAPAESQVNSAFDLSHPDDEPMRYQNSGNYGDIDSNDDQNDLDEQENAMEIDDNHGALSQGPISTEDDSQPDFMMDRGTMIE